MFYSISDLLCTYTFSVYQSLETESNHMSVLARVDVGFDL